MSVDMRAKRALSRMKARGFHTTVTHTGSSLLSSKVKACPDKVAVCQRVRVLPPDIFAAESQNRNQCDESHKRIEKNKKNAVDILATLVRPNIIDK